MMIKIALDKLEVSLSINASHPQAQGSNLGSIAQLRGRLFVLASLVLSQFCKKDIQKSKILTYFDQSNFLIEILKVKDEENIDWSDTDEPMEVDAEGE